MDLVWNATSAGSLTSDANWLSLNIRNSSYQWTASGSGTSEYYLEASGGGDPGIGEPDTVLEDGSAMTGATAGSLTAGQWDWADNDTLGFSTVYVRLTDSVDPDSKADGFVAARRDPIASDDVLFISNAINANAGFDSPTVTLTSLDVQASYTGQFTDEWHIGATTVNIGRNLGSGEPAGSAKLLFDFGTVQFNCSVWKTSTTPADANRESLRLRGTHASNVLTVYGGLVGVATNNPADTATVTLNQSGGTVNLGSGVTLKNATLEGSSSILRVRNGVDTGGVLLVKGGVAHLFGTATIPTLDVQGGTANDYSTGTYTTVNVLGNSTHNGNSGAKTITTLNLYGTLDLSNATGTLTVGTFNVLSENARVIDPNNKLATNTDFVFGAGVRKFTYEHGGGVTIRRQA